MSRRACAVIVALVGLTFHQFTRSEPLYDEELRAAIERIPAIDNHTHSLPVPADFKVKWNAAQPLGDPPYPMVVRLRVDNPEWLQAWRALYGYAHRDLATQHVVEALQAKQRLLDSNRDRYDEVILDRANVAIALVNADALGLGQRGPRFRWVPYVDPLLRFPARPPGEDPKGVLGYAGVKQRPATLDEYLLRVVVPTVQRWKKEGVPAAKVFAAYRRSIDFRATPREAAATAYAQLSSATAPAAAATLVEDFLLFEVAREAGRAGIVMHFHTGNGVGPFFDNSKANPLLLEPLLNAPELHDTRFVLIHGGWPFEQFTAALLDKPNVYADFSVQTFLLSAPTVARTLRSWLELMPEKVLFATDAYSDENTPLADWEEKEWLMTKTGRDALAIALTGMMRDDVIDRDRALDIARDVMHDNAARLYGMPLLATAKPAS